MDENVYLVSHVHVIEDGEEDVKLIGIYSSMLKAEEAVERLKLKTGFKDAKKGFSIDKYLLDIDNWTEGYITE